MAIGTKSLAVRLVAGAAFWVAAGLLGGAILLSALFRDYVERGFDAGADDYVTKPFHMEEVIARLRALIRRAAGLASPELICGPLRVDTRSGRASVDGNPVKLTANEFKVLAYLMHHQGKVISRTELTEHIYDQDFDRDSNTIEVFVGRLRKKLAVDLIQTVRGLGYRLEPPAES